MDLSKLTSNEKLAVYGSAAVVLARLISSWGGLLFLAILAAIGMLAVIFLPQLSPATALPGTKGTLMAALGIVAAVAAVITALQWLAYLGLLGSLNTIISSWPWSARSSRHGRDGRSLAIRSSALSTATAFVGWGSSRGPRSAGGPAAATLGTS